MQSGADPTTDVPYTAGFYREMAPSHVAFAALVGGSAPGAAVHPRRVLELGFGQGFGLALLAAANPDVIVMQEVMGSAMAEKYKAELERLMPQTTWSYFFRTDAATDSSSAEAAASPDGNSATPAQSGPSSSASAPESASDVGVPRRP